MSEDVRRRLYGHYVSSGHSRPPESLAGLAPRASCLRRVVERHFPPDRTARVFDVGCGYGALLHFAREAGCGDVRGVDVSQEQVDAARRLGIKGVSRGNLLEALRGLPEGSQDVVVALDVLEHFSKAEILGLVDAVPRVLRPGGGAVSCTCPTASRRSSARSATETSPTSWPSPATRCRSCCWRRAIRACAASRTSRSPTA